MERGEVWWALIEERCRVVLLSGEVGSEVRAMRIVAPATAEEKHGFVILSGEEAIDPGTMQQVIGSAGTAIIGVEVEIDPPEGLSHGVVRVALPRKGHVFCTWLVTLTRDSLVERLGALSGTKLDQLGAVLRLARIE